MNYKDAFETLEIDTTNMNYNDISLDYLKKKYHKLSLQKHPDKNGNTFESNEKFKKINEAYNYLKREMSDLQEEKEEPTSFMYIDILQLFMKSILEVKYNELILRIVNNIVGGLKIQVTVNLFDDLDKNTSIYIYNFLSKYRSILHLSQDNLDDIRNIVIKKYENVLAYKLNPSINDLFNNNLYKLYVENQLFLVPLWYNEVYFDGSGCEIIVICDPELPECVKMDDDNNIHIEKTVLFQNIILEKDISIEIGEKIFKVPVCDLYIKKEQYYRIKNQGLSKIKNDIYDVSEKADIIVKISISF